MAAKKSKNWLAKQREDHFVRQAAREGYRSRAVYKLMQIDQRDRLIIPGMRIVDLGAAPGGWSQYAAQRVGAKGIVVAVDRLPMNPINNVVVISGDVTRMDTQRRVLDVLDGAPDLVISDMAPNITGIAETDQARTLELLQAAAEFARTTVRYGGAILLKVFEGPCLADFRAGFRQYFKECLVRKPSASRSRSREHYLLFRGLKS